MSILVHVGPRSDYEWEDEGRDDRDPDVVPDVVGDLLDRLLAEVHQAQLTAEVKYEQDVEDLVHCLRATWDETFNRALDGAMGRALLHRDYAQMERLLRIRFDFEAVREHPSGSV